MNKPICFIGARGGSKGIPNKNLQTVGGITLLARTISACLQSASIASVYVSTDSEEIAAVALRSGAKVIRRPAEISGDSASSESALLHALDEIEKQTSLPKDVLLAQCTSPFISHVDIDGVIGLLQNHDSALTVTHNHAFIWRRDRTPATESALHQYRLSALCFVPAYDRWRKPVIPVGSTWNGQVAA